MATMVANDNLLKDAALIVDVCFSVEDGDVVTIICDDDREQEEETGAVKAERVALDQAGIAQDLHVVAHRWLRTPGRLQQITGTDLVGC